MRLIYKYPALITAIQIICIAAAVQTLHMGKYIYFLPIALILIKTLSPGKIKLWCDRTRPSPAGYTHHARNAKEAIHLLQVKIVTHLSVSGEFIDVATYIRTNAKYIKPITNMQIHSGANAAAIEIAKKLNRAIEIWDVGQFHINVTDYLTIKQMGSDSLGVKA